MAVLNIALGLGWYLSSQRGDDMMIIAQTSVAHVSTCGVEMGMRLTTIETGYHALALEYNLLVGKDKQIPVLMAMDPTATDGG